jgi:hypothetical protein
MSPGQSRPHSGRGVSWNGGPTRISGEPPNVRKYRAQNDHVERSDLAKRFFIAGWERERAERAKRERKRGTGA